MVRPAVPRRAPVAAARVWATAGALVTALLEPAAVGEPENLLAVADVGGARTTYRLAVSAVSVLLVVALALRWAGSTRPERPRPVHPNRKASASAAMATSVTSCRIWPTERAVEKHVAAIFGKLGLPAGGETHRRVLAVLAFLRG